MAPPFRNFVFCLKPRFLNLSNHLQTLLDYFSLDPIPTKLCTECLDVSLTPITKLINPSLESGCFPLPWKRALIKPLLKEDGLDPIFKNYRSVSNLAYALKLVDTVVAK